MNNDEPLALLRQLKGSPLSVLIALKLVHQPVGERFLIQVTGYSQNMVRNALGYLNECNLAQRNGRYGAWILCDGVRQLPLMAEMLESGESINDSPDPSATATTAIVETPKSMGKKQQQQKRESLNDSPANAVLEELHAQGIMGRKALQLSQLAWMTIPYIQAHAIKAKEENISTGLLICRMSDHDPIDIKSKEELEREKYLKSWGR
jgi:predicted transcriptional regulator